jgi:hypothetical protein
MTVSNVFEKDRWYLRPRVRWGVARYKRYNSLLVCV